MMWSETDAGIGRLPAAGIARGPVQQRQRATQAGRYGAEQCFVRGTDCRGRRQVGTARPEDLDRSPAGAYDISMNSFRILVTVLAVIHAVFAGFTALVGTFANGGDVWQRLLVILLHPLGAAGVLLLVLRPRLTTTTILALVALLTANVIADLGVVQLMAAGRVRGDWELALTFSVVPAIGIVYALALLRTARGIAG